MRILSSTDTVKSPLYGFFHNRQQGFSLIQVSAILVVASIIMVSMLPGSKNISDAGKQAITEMRMKKIEEAMQGYMATNSRRLCPADPTLPATDPNFGEEDSCVTFNNTVSITGTRVANSAVVTMASNPTVGTCLGCISIGAIVSGTGIYTGTRVVAIDEVADTVTLDYPASAAGTTALSFTRVGAGGVPTSALALPSEYAFDGYGRRIMYVVDQMATSAQYCSNLQSNGEKGGIEIMETVDSGVSAANAVAAKDRVMWALISYGKDGHGAYSSGTDVVASRINMGSTDVDTLNNAFVPEAGDFNAPRMTGKLVKRENIPTTDSFDDYVWYNESTKNTCCIGKKCNDGFYIIHTGTGSLTTTAYDTNLQVATGNFNGDGFEDIVIGSRTTPTYGRAFVIFGNKRLPVSALTAANLQANQGFQLVNTHTNTVQTFAGTIAVGDLTTDGNDDILISSLSASSRYHMVFGYPCYLTAALVGAGQTCTLPWAQSSANISADGYYGVGMSQAAFNTITPGSAVIGKKINSGAVNDSAIANKEDASVVYMLWGRSGHAAYATGFRAPGGSPQTFSITNVANTITTTDATDSPLAQGRNALSTGDVNGDGYDELLMGAYTADTAGIVDTGTAYIFFGRGASGPAWGNIAIPVLIGTNFTSGNANGSNLALRLTGLGTTNNYFGWTVKLAKLNSDAYADIIVTTKNKIYVYYGEGSADFYDRFTVPADSWGSGTTINLSRQANFTIDVSTSKPAWITADTLISHLNVADVNNDGKNDLIIGSYDTNPTINGTARGTSTGSIFVLFQPQTGWNSSANAANGTISFASNPVNNYSFRINDVDWVFVTSGASGSQTNIKASLALTLDQLAIDMNASADPEISKSTYSITGGNTLNIMYDEVTPDGDLVTLDVDGGNATASGATLNDGSPADLKMFGGSSTANWFDTSGNAYTNTDGTAKTGIRIDGPVGCSYLSKPAFADLNADGRTDIVVPAPGFGASNTYPPCAWGAGAVGRTYVLLGQDNWDPAIDLADWH